jgi:hypothetical protein
LQRESTSAVLPEPTGPPTPTRNTSGLLFMGADHTEGARSRGRSLVGDPPHLRQMT